MRPWEASLSTEMPLGNADASDLPLAHDGRLRSYLWGRTAMLRFCLFLLVLARIAPAQEPISPDAAQKLAQATFREYLDLLALPNDAIQPRDIQSNVGFLERAFRKRGFTTQKLENHGRPMLYAEWPNQAPGAKTVLYYMHLDGQPVVDREWSQPSPW